MKADEGWRSAGGSVLRRQRKRKRGDDPPRTLLWDPYLRAQSPGIGRGYLSVLVLQSTVGISHTHWSPIIHT